MDERQLFPHDDQDDSELFERLQEHVLEKYPNPERIGCIDHTSLETWVYAPEKLESFRSEISARPEVCGVYTRAD